MSRFSLGKLTSVFYRTSSGSKPSGYITGIYISEPLYTLYLSLYQASSRFADALQNVIDDGEHRLVMEEASQAGYTLPDIQLFQDELTGFKGFLKEFDPYRFETRHNGEIRLPYATARNLHALVHYNCVMVSHTLSACFDTEYLKYFKDLQTMGIPYTGATALQEMQDVLTCLSRNRIEHDRCDKVETRPERKEWPALLV
jgi:hypothetical protein